MKKILSILLFLTSCATVDTSFKEITVLKSLQQGMTIKDFITLNGPPFSIEDNEDGVVFIFYERSFWASRADFVGIYMDVKKNVLKFDNQGIFLEKLSKLILGLELPLDLGPSQKFLGLISLQQVYETQCQT